MPEGFTVHPKLVTPARQAARGRRTGGGIDWAHAEALAYASLLSEGTPIRLTGQDVERGTFSQRHLVFHDAKTGQRTSPIQNLPGALAPMELHNSPLSEVACLGFEYGYSMEAPESLVLWEAQFGDFANSAQVIVDQFIISGAGQVGADVAPDAAAAARLRGLGPRALHRPPGALPAARRRGQHPRREPDDAGAVLPPAAPPGARRQAAPAGHLHPEAAAAPAAGDVARRPPDGVALLPGAVRAAHRRGGVTRLVFCTGKVFYDLKGHVTREDNPGVAISRVELLYPFPQAQILEEIDRYPNLREVLWVQEEPRNMGARAHMSPRMLQILPRTSSSATSAGPSAPARARATRPPTPSSRTASSARRSTSTSRCRSTRPTRRATARAFPAHLQGRVQAQPLGGSTCRSGERKRRNPLREAVHVREDFPLYLRRRARAGNRHPLRRSRLRRGPLAAPRQAQPRLQQGAEHRDADHRLERQLRHAPVEHQHRRRRQRGLRLSQLDRERALPVFEQPQQRPRVRVHLERQRGRLHQGRRPQRQALRDQRHRRRHRPQRRQGRRP